jgi:hypothetical protein
MARPLIHLDLITLTIFGEVYRLWSSYILFHCAKESVHVRGALKHFVTIENFYGEGLLAPRPTPKLEDHPFLAVHDCLFNIFTATVRARRNSLHPQPEDAPCRGDKGPT